MNTGIAVIAGMRWLPWWALIVAGVVVLACLVAWSLCVAAGRADQLTALSRGDIDASLAPKATSVHVLQRKPEPKPDPDDWGWEWLR